MELDPFRTMVRAEGVRLYRDLPWRNVRDPYAVWISEVMLQQTQVPRVLARWEAWLDRFPDVRSLAAAPTAQVLEAWQGMGYNRRALALKAAAEAVVRERDGVFPRDARALTELPGIGPATAQGIRSFAYDLPGVYLETNVRTVFLHHMFPDVPAVPDRELVPLVARTCPAAPAGEGEGEDEDEAAAGSHAVPQDADDTPRAWYYALLDYGAHLKKTIPNPSRRSKSYARQSRFEGSRRQKRAAIVRMLLEAQVGGAGLTVEMLRERLSASEARAGRGPVDGALVGDLLLELAHEGFCREDDGAWRIA